MVFDIGESLERFLSRLQQLNENKPLVGGWEEHLSNNVTEQDGVKYLHCFKLCEKKRRTDSHNLYVSDKRNYFAIRNEVLKSIKTFLKQRFDDKEFVELNAIKHLPSAKEEDL